MIRRTGASPDRTAVVAFGAMRVTAQEETCMLLAGSVCMMARVLLLLVFVIPVGFGQMGLYGPISSHVKAGDLAPDIKFAKTLNAPVAGSWSQANLSGQVTVLTFMPDTSHNPEIVELWNAEIKKFNGKLVQFVWITGEKESTLLPWLDQHPIEGWVFLDPKGQTGNAYGMELPANVIVGTDRKIVGFYDGITQTGDLLKAVEQDRITTAPPDRANLKAFIESHKMRMNAEPPRMSRFEGNRPAIPPSYTVHISLSQGGEHGNSSGDDLLALKGYTLKEAIDELDDVNPIRVHLPAAIDNSKRYDFVLVLPQQEGREQKKDRMRQGLLDYFHVSERREDRLVDVYVVSALPKRKPPAAKSTDDGMGGVNVAGIEFGGMGDGLDEISEGMKPQSIGSVRSVSINGTVDQFCHWLETGLDRPVVNETTLEGIFRFDVKSSEGKENDFLERLRGQTGIVISPAERNIETLVFEPR